MRSSEQNPTAPVPHSSHFRNSERDSVSCRMFLGSLCIYTLRLSLERAYKYIHMYLTNTLSTSPDHHLTFEHINLYHPLFEIIMPHRVHMSPNHQMHPFFPLCPCLSLRHCRYHFPKPPYPSSYSSGSPHSNLKEEKRVPPRTQKRKTPDILQIPITSLPHLERSILHWASSQASILDPPTLLSPLRPPIRNPPKPISQRNRRKSSNPNRNRAYPSHSSLLLPPSPLLTSNLSISLNHVMSKGKTYNPHLEKRE